MSIISTSKKFIFIHIPKTAGTSIRHILKQHENPSYGAEFNFHESALDVKRRISSDIFDNSYKFAFIRNPWDRMYSFYKYLISGKFNVYIPELVPYHHWKEIGFKRWLLEEEFYIPSHKLPTPDMVPMQRKDMLSWISDDNGNLLVDFIGRFENIKEDYRTIAAHLDLEKKRLPRRNKSKRKHDYRTEYDNEMIDFVEFQFKRDINAFNYTFE